MPFGRPNKSGTDRPARSGSRARFPYQALWVSLTHGCRQAMPWSGHSSLASSSGAAISIWR